MCYPTAALEMALAHLAFDREGLASSLRCLCCIHYTVSAGVEFVMLEVN
jgi:hypothetical protein